MAPVVGFQQTKWENWIAFPASGIGLAQTLPLWTFGKPTAVWDAVSLLLK